MTEMTYEDLQVKLAEGLWNFELFHDKVCDALHAVITLHSPCTGEDHDDSPELADTPCICKGCHEGDGSWPCPTIKAVMKQLSDD